MKTILHPSDAEQIIHRVKQLNASSYRRWGRLSVGEMIYHCTCVNLAVSGAPPSQKSPSLKQHLLRILVLDILKKLPRGARGDPEFFSRQVIPFTDQGKEDLLSSIRVFGDKNIIPGGQHHVFGRLSQRNWGRFIWIHLDHHLRQFGE